MLCRGCGRNRQKFGKSSEGSSARPTFSWQEQVEFENSEHGLGDLILTTRRLLMARPDPGEEADFQTDHRAESFLGDQAFKLSTPSGLPRLHRRRGSRRWNLTLISRALNARSRPSKRAPAHPGKARPSRPPIPPTNSFRNPNSKAIARLAPTDCEVLAIISQRPGRAATQTRRRRRNHPRSHSVLRRIRRASRRPRMVLLRRSQHRRRRSERLLLADSRRACASSHRQDNQSA